MTEALGPYRLVRELGRGGMGVVYEAQHPEIPRRLAVKTILTTLAKPEELARFQREAHSLAKVSHPNVVRIHDLGSDVRGLYLVTDLVEGEDLKQVCRRGPADPRQAASILKLLCDAVAAIHALGILHRDLKPENVVLRPDQTPVLLDFGLARELDAETLTQTGALVGTPHYMAPEQADGAKHGALDERTDVYGLGAVLFTLLAGGPPFQGGSLVNVIRRVLLEDPAWPRGPASLLAVCRKAMAKKPADRYPSALALGEDLERFLRGEPVKARAASRVRAAGGAALVAILGISAALWWTRGSEPTPDPPAPHETKPAPPPGPSPAKRAASLLARGAERSTRDPKQLAGVHLYLDAVAWLEQNRGAAAALTGRVQALVDQLRQRPLAVLATERDPLATHGAFLSEDRLLLSQHPGRLWLLDLRGHQEPRSWWFAVRDQHVGISAIAPHGTGFLYAADESVYWVAGPQAKAKRVWSVPKDARHLRADSTWRTVYELRVDARGRVAVCGDWLHVYSFELTDPAKTTRAYGPHPGRPRTVALAGDGRHLLSGVDMEGQGWLFVWDLKTRRRVFSLRNPDRLHRVACWGETTFALGRNTGVMALFEEFAGQEQDRLLPRPGPDDRDLRGTAKVQGLVFSPDGARLYSLSGWDKKKEGRVAYSELRAWDTRARTQVGKRIRLRDGVRANQLAISPKGHLLMLGTKDGEAILWGAPPRAPGS